MMGWMHFISTGMEAIRDELILKMVNGKQMIGLYRGIFFGILSYEYEEAQ